MFVFLGILHVTAEDKSTGRNKRIEIKNDKGRLTQAEIERMINDAERYRAEDEEARELADVRNHLETYLYSCKQAVETYNGSAITNSDKSLVINACKEVQEWLDRNRLAVKDEIEHQYSELQKKCQHIMIKMHGGGMDKQQYNSSRNARDGGYSGPRVEEVD